MLFMLFNLQREDSEEEEEERYQKPFISLFSLLQSQGVKGLSGKK